MFLMKRKENIKGVSSSIRDHIKDTGHNASIDDFCIIDNTSNEFDLLIHESLLILRDRPTLNQQILDSSLSILVPPALLLFSATLLFPHLPLFASLSHIGYFRLFFYFPIGLFRYS